MLWKGSARPRWLAWRTTLPPLLVHCQLAVPSLEATGVLWDRALSLYHSRQSLAVLASQLPGEIAALRAVVQAGMGLVDADSRVRRTEAIVSVEEKQVCF